jgi:DNA-directed RNA polymerase specialized sigma24 family protein
MKNHTDSDYALNKYSGGMVYRFAAGRRRTITLADYLAENPGKTASDAIYLGQVRADNAQTKKNVSIHGFEDGDHFGGATLEEDFLEGIDREATAKAFAAMLADGALTETQERRFRMSVFGGMTQREIAARESVTSHAVALSIKDAVSALKNISTSFRFSPTQSPGFITRDERQKSAISGATLSTILEKHRDLSRSNRTPGNVTVPTSAEKMRSIDCGCGLFSPQPHSDKPQAYRL